MDAERLATFRGLLESRLVALLQTAAAPLPGEVDAPPPSVDDLRADSTNPGFLLRLQERDRDLVQKIRAALRRVDDGEYGVCVSCGNEIGERRLLARPVATHCIDCKTEVDSREIRSRLF